MYRIVEIPRGTLPDKDAEIYPDIQIVERLVYQNREVFYYLMLRTFVPIVREEGSYLIPVFFKYSQWSPNANIKEHKWFKEKRLQAFVSECAKVILYYKVPDTTNLKSIDGGTIIIYKYMENAKIHLQES